MRIVFLGTPEFAVPALRALLGSSHEVVAVFTQPDRPAGRGKHLHAPPVKLIAQRAAVPVYQPPRIRSEENRALFESFAPDFLVVVAYGQLLPGWLLGCARVAPVNVHASLLPAYRGAAPILWAILNGETGTGVTTMWMEEQLDAGPILLSASRSIPESMTTGALAESLAQMGAELILPTLDGLASGQIIPRAQEHARATWAPRVDKSMAAVNWDCHARAIHNRARAFNPWPLAYASFRGQRIQLLQTTPEENPAADPLRPGTFLGRQGEALRVQCGQGTVLRLLELKLQSRQPMSGAAFANGFHLNPGEPIFSPAIEAGG